MQRNRRGRMLPACRTAGDEFAIPPFELTPRDVAGFTDELQEFQGLFHDCFPRSEPRAHFFDYMVGQLSPLARKSIEPMALRVPGGSVRGLQRFLSEVPWDEEHMRWTYHQLVAEEMGEPDGVLMFDETGFVKKGTDSVGVARQYCGPLGKVENCQVGGGRALPPGKAMRSWTSGCSCRNGGGRTRMRPAGPSVTCPPNSRFRANRSWRRPC